MASVAANMCKCPNCDNFYDCPKLLRCDHNLCRNCVISCLRMTGGRGECPICRAPILSAIPQDQGQLEAQVDNLRTDRATEVLADSHRILSDPGECKICLNNVAALNFCLECSVKLCASCTEIHQKFPVISHHTVKKLTNVRVKELARRHKVKCTYHSQAVKVYCPSSKELMCRQCRVTTRRDSLEVKEIADAAKEERRKLKDQLGKMKKRKAAKQISDAKEKIKTMRETAKSVFDDLRESVEKQHCNVSNFIQAEEDKKIPRLDFDRRHIENLVEESSDDVLLQTLQQLAPRLQKLEQNMTERNDLTDVRLMVFDDQIITRLKSDLEKVGRIQQPRSQPTSAQAAGVAHTTSDAASVRRRRPQSQLTPPSAIGTTPATSATTSGLTTADKLQEGAAVARHLKVGHKVKLAPDVPAWGMQGVQPGERGTIRATSSRIQAKKGMDSEGLMDVCWDKAGVRCHFMGLNDQYHLIRV